MCFFYDIIRSEVINMYSLFLDTHSRNIIEVLYKNGEVIDKSIRISEHNHSDYTMPMLKSLLDNNKITVKDLNEIFVVNGPGSFTGVRLGVTIAKTLAYTLNIPIKTITSLECLAISSNTTSNKLPIIRDVKGVFSCLYTSENKPLTEAFYKTNDELKQYISENNLADSVIENADYDYEKIYKFFNSIKPINAHSVNPVYIKVIEALKND